MTTATSVIAAATNGPFSRRRGCRVSSVSIRTNIDRGSLPGTRDAEFDPGGFSLNGERHICAFFHDKDEEYRTLLPFIAEGIRNGEKAIHLIDENYREAHTRRLQDGGIDVRSVTASGQLEIRGWGDAYLDRGRFDIDAMLSMIETLLDKARAQGYPRSRLVADMAWALMNRPGVTDLIAYEARLNTLLEGRDDPVICVYDLSRFGGAVVMDVMKTHPLAVVGGVMQHNPFFIAPLEMMRELDRRPV